MRSRIVAATLAVLLAGGIAAFADGLSGGNFFTSLVLGSGVQLQSPSATGLQIGGPDNAAPANQTLTVGENARAGVDTNGSGGAGIIQPGLGTGTGNGSSLRLLTPVQVASGTGAQTQSIRVLISESTPTASAIMTIQGTDLKFTVGGQGFAPTMGACGTTPTLTAGSTDSAGEITTGTTTTSCVLNFGSTKANPPFCIVTQENTNLAAFTYVAATTTLTITQTSTSNNKFAWVCIQH